MEALGATAAYASYSADDFEATRSFYELKLGCTPVLEWDRADGRGVYYQLGDVPVAEILDTATGQPLLSTPEPWSLSIVVIVVSARQTHDELVARGVAVTSPLVGEPWGIYFGVEDPNGVPLYFVQQAPVTAVSGGQPV
jgi:catechol 2,3-dioxygenase-like lactoylglutathione lyase family enzyme